MEIILSSDLSMSAGPGGLQRSMFSSVNTLSPMPYSIYA